MTSFPSASLLRVSLLAVGLIASPWAPRLALGQSVPVVASAASALRAPAVPTQLEFADMRLTFTPGGQAAVQKLVDALYRHPAYLEQKVDRAGIYFPIITRVLTEEGVPSDFRYLCVQESGLVSDAVSTSNAVGFWQFKQASATELGARVNDQVDERRHLVESTRAAAKYLKRSNAQLHNWVNSLMSYYTGLGGAKKLVKPTDLNNREMEISESTHTYILTFLAHKLAFEGPYGQAAVPGITLQEVKAKPGQTLTELAQSLNANPEEVVRYNKWLLASTVPADKEYTVLVPTPVVTTLAAANLTATAQVAFPEMRTQVVAPEITQVNGLRAVVARKGDTPAILALVAGMDEKRFRFLNDLTNFEGVVEGRAYYLQKKRNKAAAEYHVVQPGETVPVVAQQYGIKAKAVWRMNRMQRNDLLEPGRLLWLQHTRPSSVAIEYVAPKNQPAPDAAPATASVAATLPGGEPVVFLDTATAITAAVDTKLADLNTAVTAPIVDTKPADGTPSPAPAVVAPTSEAGPLPAVVLEATPAVAPETAPAPVLAVEPAPAPAAPASTEAVTLAPATATAPVVTAAPAPDQQDATQKSGGAAPATKVPQPLPEGSAATTHTVAKGESLSVISRRYNTSLQNLMEWNGLTSPNLRAGQTLRVSAPEAAASTTTTPVTPLPVRPDVDSAGATWHTVRAGESLYRISKQYNTTVQTLMDWNTLTDFNVKLGQKLVVKK